LTPLRLLAVSALFAVVVVGGAAAYAMSRAPHDETAAIDPSPSPKSKPSPSPKKSPTSPKTHSPEHEYSPQGGTGVVSPSPSPSPADPPEKPSPSSPKTATADQKALASWRRGTGWESEEFVYPAYADSSTSNVWVVGQRGTILASNDGGASWAPQESGTDAILQDVAFADADRGIVVGYKDPYPYKGWLLTTSDGGQQWQRSSSARVKKVVLSGVDSLDPTTACAVGKVGQTGIGTILISRDAGQTWERAWQQSGSGPPTWLTGVAFCDSLHGLVVGAEGTILSTDDGGENWEPRTSPTSLWLTKVAFVDASHAWAVGGNPWPNPDFGIILASSDGGVTWKKQYSGWPTLYGVAFADRLHGWAVGVDGTLLGTADGGKTWTRYPTTQKGLWGVAFADTDHSIAVGSGGTILVGHQPGD
jgi:photosystem II stability/assembly factor-like uncharacterized protein